MSYIQQIKHKLAPQSLWKTFAFVLYRKKNLGVQLVFCDWAGEGEGWETAAVCDFVDSRTETRGSSV